MLRSVYLRGVEFFVVAIIEKKSGGYTSRAKCVRHHLGKGAIETKISGPVGVAGFDVCINDLKTHVECLVHFNVELGLGHSLLAPYNLSTRIHNYIDPLFHLLNRREVRVLENCTENLSFRSRQLSCNGAECGRRGQNSGGHD